ncbi:hypothetical protein TKK_0009120 [Trichogramma kaykai]|uniref:Uncharacterized protein n=1 Tax=Trichogramma kaykai TaxID=54128 RepID=A0ABD2X4F3_9HYME
MFKLAVFLALVGCALAAPKPGLLLAEPVVQAAPVIASAPVATSYQNTVKISKSSPVITTTYHAAAPLAVHAVHAAPVLHAVHAAPALHVAHAAPLAVAHHASLHYV